MSHIILLIYFALISVSKFFFRNPLKEENRVPPQINPFFAFIRGERELIPAKIN